jgi:hypothetical protein
MPLDATQEDVESVAELVCDRMFLEEFSQEDSATDIYVTGADEEIHGLNENRCDYRAYRTEDGKWRVKPKSKFCAHRFSF